MEANIIERTLKENILDKNTVFVFNTDVAANSWTDFVVRQDGNDGWPRSVEQERFLAWDAFKGQALKSKQSGQEAVPSLLRKLFARLLLERIKDGEKIFERLINSEYKENALSFTDWISGLLPSLGRWRALAQKFIKDGQLCGERDNPENRDYLKLYDLYSTFLQERNLFEPSWQSARFDSENKKNFIVLFPELLDDFDEYKEVLQEAQQAGRVRLVAIPKTDTEIRADYWTSMRLELRMAALRIIKAQKEGADWNDISLCVPDIENLRPYVERELALYQIPFVTRSGIKLGKTGAGRVFRKIQDCVQNNFSYQSVRSLVLDANIPWKDPAEMEILTRLGKESKCLMQYTDSAGNVVDPWLLDLSEGVSKDDEAKEFLDAKKFYASLKNSAVALARSKTFSAIKANWKKFEDEFILPKQEITEEGNNILSRCVALLDELCALEDRFPEVAKGRSEAYSFFLNEIENSQYQPRQKKRGVSVFDYKVSAQAAIKKQFVINASQNKITVEKLALSFLSPKERSLLLDQNGSDHSAAYVQSYALCSDCSFSASQGALDGFAIPHSALAADQEPKQSDPGLDADDFIRNQTDAPRFLTDAQKKSFENYFFKNKEKENAGALDDGGTKDCLAAVIDKTVKENRGARDGTQDRIHITPSDLKEFFPCPRKWIFKRLLRVNEFSLDTDLFETYDQGSVNHKILEIYFAHLKAKGEPLPTTDQETGKIARNGEDCEQKTLLPFLEAAAQKAFLEAKAYKKSALVQEALKSQNKMFAQKLLQFLREFCAEENFGGWSVEEIEWGNGNDADIPPLLQGRMDLVLRSPQGQIALVDYKNSRAAIPAGDLTLKGQPQNQDGSPKELDDCQMAAYTRLWESANKSPDKKVSRASFVSIKRFEEKRVIIPNPDSRSKAVERQDFEAALQSLERRIRSMEKSLVEKNFSLKEVKPYKDCDACPFNSICRTTY